MRSADGEREDGPFTAKQISQRMAAGELDWTCEVWREGLSSFRPARRDELLVLGVASVRGLAGATMRLDSVSSLLQSSDTRLAAPSEGEAPSSSARQGLMDELGPLTEAEAHEAVEALEAGPTMLVDLQSNGLAGLVPEALVPEAPPERRRRRRSHTLLEAPRAPSFAAETFVPGSVPSTSSAPPPRASAAPKVRSSLPPPVPPEALRGAPPRSVPPPVPAAARTEIPRVPAQPRAPVTVTPGSRRASSIPPSLPSARASAAPGSMRALAAADETAARPSTVSARPPLPVATLPPALPSPGSHASRPPSSARDGYGASHAARHSNSQPAPYRAPMGESHQPARSPRVVRSAYAEPASEAPALRVGPIVSVPASVPPPGLVTTARPSVPPGDERTLLTRPARRGGGRMVWVALLAFGAGALVAVGPGRLTDLARALPQGLRAQVSRASLLASPDAAPAAAVSPVSTPMPTAEASAQQPLAQPLLEPPAPVPALPPAEELRSELRRLGPLLLGCLAHPERGLDLTLTVAGESGRVQKLQVNAPPLRPGARECVDDAVSELHVAPFSDPSVQVAHHYAW